MSIFDWFKSNSNRSEQPKTKPEAERPRPKTIDEMTTDEALSYSSSIIRKYGQALENAASTKASFYDEDLLPCEKSKVQKAIEIALLHAEFDETTFGQLRFAFVETARFQPGVGDTGFAIRESVARDSDLDPRDPADHEKFRESAKDLMQSGFFQIHEKVTAEQAELEIRLQGIEQTREQANMNSESSHDASEARMEDMSPDELNVFVTTVTQSFGRLLQELARPRFVVHDEDRLPFPKEIIRKCVLFKLKLAPLDQATYKAFRAAFLATASFQPNVGEEGILVGTLPSELDDKVAARQAEAALIESGALEWFKVRQDEEAELEAMLKQLGLE